MEEKKPLESRSLTHTSKEPEGQSWAQIGTAAYDPPISKSASSSSTTTEKLNNGGVASDEGSNSAQEESTAKASQPEKNSSDGIGDEASDLELHVDVNAEPSQAEATEKEAAEVEDKKKDATENRKRSILGDGFESKLEDEKSEESRSRRDRSRSRSRDRDRDRRSWRDVDRTNSNDPRSVRSRVFVGHLNTADSECSREAMEKLFSPFGKVMGINLQNGYGFVQFEEEDFAKAAIKELHGITFCGTKIVVDRPVALRKMDESRYRERDRDLYDELERLRRRDLYDRYARLEEMERYYYERDRRERDRYHYPPPADYMDRGDNYRGGSGGGGAGSYDRYRDDPYDMPRGGGGHYMGRGDPYDHHMRRY